MTRLVTRQDFRLLLIFLRIRKCENCTCVPVTCVEENLLFCFSGVVFLGLFFWGCFSGVVFLGWFFWGERGAGEGEILGARMNRKST